jgi:hypothetical protein
MNQDLEVHKACVDCLKPPSDSFLVWFTDGLIILRGAYYDIVMVDFGRRLKPGGGGVNAAIYKAAGHDLEQATKQYASTLNPGSAVVVPLPLSSPLRKVEGVTHVIHVLGPNMNPQRPNCLAGDYVQGCQILRATYASLFNAFSTTVKGQASLPLGFASQEQAGDIVAQESNKFKNGGGVRGGASSTRPRLANAFTILMNAAKQKDTGELDTMPKRKRPVEKELNEIHSEIRRPAGTSDASNTHGSVRNGLSNVTSDGGKIPQGSRYALVYTCCFTVLHSCCVQWPGSSILGLEDNIQCGEKL